MRRKTSVFEYIFDFLSYTIDKQMFALYNTNTCTKPMFWNAHSINDLVSVFPAMEEEYDVKLIWVCIYEGL